MTSQPKPSAVQFGQHLRFLRRRARLSQTELSIAVGYSDAQISRLENGRRLPDLTTLVALFLPALDLDPRSADARLLLELAAAARQAGETPAGEDVAPALAARLPDAADPERATLPQPPTPLVGRGRERAALAGLLADGARLVTLIGPAGIGKTRLALQIAHDTQDRFAAGAAFIDLSSATDVEPALQSIAQGLNVAEDAGTTTLDATRDALSRRDLLLVLDNLEQVPDLTPALGALLTAAPGLRLLVTSRVALRLEAETLFHVPPLAVPDLAHLPPPEELARVESVALLLARLRADLPDMELNEGNALALAAICARVDGLPLAIELVAAYGRLFSPQELLREIAQHFMTMRRRGADTPDRHRTLDAALAWSFDQLAPETQALFARLSVFANGWSAEAAAAVCDLDEGGRAGILNGLQDLLDHSLVRRSTTGDVARLHMLAMVREYAADRLAAWRESDDLHDRMLGYFTDMAEEAERSLSFGAEQGLWLTRLSADHDNLRATLAWAMENGQRERGLRLSAALWRFWYMRGFLREGRGWLEIFLREATAASPPTAMIDRARALDGAGILAWRQGDYRQAEQWCGDSLALFRGAGDVPGQARTLSHLGMFLAEQGRYEQAAAHYEASLPLYRALGDEVGAVSVLHNMANMACQQNDNDRAFALFDQCLPIYERVGDQSGLALAALGLGAIYRDRGENDEARRAFADSLELARELGDEWNEATALINLGDLAADDGDFVESRRLLTGALELFEAMGDQQSASICMGRLGGTELLAGAVPAALRWFRQSLMLSNAIGFTPGIPEALEGVAGCIASARPLSAASLLAAAEALRERESLPLALADRPRIDRIVAIVQRGADEATLAVAWREGRDLATADAVALALSASAGTTGR
jgi:predicted ATPase/DNA-binding XRE family transcriptional regulator